MGNWHRALALVTLCGCAPAPDWQRTAPAVPPMESLAPAGPRPPLPAGAETFGGEAAAEPTPPSSFEAQILAEVEAAAASVHEPAPFVDARLDRAAAEIARLALDGVPSDEEARFIFAHFGVVESTRILVERFGADERSFWDELRIRLRGELGATERVIGIGVAGLGDEKVVVLAHQRGALALSTFPRELPVGEGRVLAGRLEGGLGDLQVIVTQVDGEARILPLTVGVDGSFRAELRCTAVGALALRMVARDARPAEVLLADVRVHCGEPVPAQLDSAPRSVAAIEAELLARVNQARRDRGVAPLAWDATATAVARAHARAMRDLGVVSHTLPGAGTLAERARSEGLVAPLVLENVARAESAEHAVLALLDAPASRDNLLSPECHHMGIGVAPARAAGSSRERAQLYVAQLLYSGDAPAAPDAALSAVVATVSRARAEARLAPLAEDAALDEIARHAAAALASGQEYPTVAQHIEAEVAAAARPVQGVVIVHAVTADLADPALGASALMRDHEVIGVGVARSSHARVGKGVLVVTLLIARLP